MATVRIPLSQGKFAIVDAEDAALVQAHKWFAAKPTKKSPWYAARSVPLPDGRATTIYMHRVIIGAGKDEKVDHRDGDGLNNRRSNLRRCTQAQNMANASIRPQNTSGFIGVTWEKSRRKWNAQIQVNGKKINLGYFDTKEEAARARAEGARRIHGEFASRHEVAA